MKYSLGLVLILIFGTSISEARVFNFKNESVATYFRGTAGLSSLQRSAFDKSGGTGLSYSDQTSYNYSGEFGLLLAMSRMNVRLGVELLRPNAVTGAEAKDASETTFYTIDSTVISYGGVLNVEFNLSEGDHSRIFFSAGGGYFNTSLHNEYKFTAASPYGLSNFVEEGSASSFMGQAAFGFEFLLSDQVTTVFDAGYRSMLVNNMKHTRDATTFSGAVHSGEAMKNTDGTDRSLDLGGIWVGVGLRFYINL